MNILVTRPKHEQAEMADRLRAMGHKAISLPLLEIVPVPFSLPDATAIDGLLFTSANALRMLEQHDRVSAFTLLPAFTVGEATRDKAVRAGFEDVTSADGDSTALAALLRKRFATKAARLVHFSGKHRAGDVATQVRSDRLQIENIECYRAEPGVEISARIQNDIRDGKIDGCILMSPRTADIYAQLIQTAGLAGNIGEISHYCISENTGQMLAPLQLESRSVLVAETPDLDAVLALL